LEWEISGSGVEKGWGLSYRSNRVTSGRE